MSIPPIGANIKQKMMNNAIAEWRGNNFSRHGIMYNKGDATTRSIATVKYAFAEIKNIRHRIKLKAMLVNRALFAFSCGIVSSPKFSQYKRLESNTALHVTNLISFGATVCDIRALRFAQFRRDGLEFFRDLGG